MGKEREERDPSGPKPPAEEVLERHLSGLRAFVRLRSNRRIRERESASDIVQSVCRELLEQEGFEYRGEAELRGWLYTAALRKIVERDRKMNAQKRDVRREVRDDGERGLLDAYATISTPSMHASAREQLARIEAAFDRLSEEQREVLSLARVAGFSHREIAERTGRSEESSRQLLRRALIRLSIVLEEDDES